MTVTERRWLRIVALWAAGASENEIALDVGMSPSVVQVTIWRLRQKGYSLPKRSYEERWANRRRAA